MVAVGAAVATATVAVGFAIGVGGAEVAVGGTVVGVAAGTAGEHEASRMVLKISNALR
jgi:hypothetical protein